MSSYLFTLYDIYLYDVVLITLNSGIYFSMIKGLDTSHLSSMNVKALKVCHAVIFRLDLSLYLKYYIKLIEENSPIIRLTYYVLSESNYPPYRRI